MSLAEGRIARWGVRMNVLVMNRSSADWIEVKAEIPVHENERLAVLQDYDVLDSASEVAFDDVTRLAAQICQAPVALISLIDQDRQWFKSALGLSASQTSRDVAFCAHAILDPDRVLEVRDAHLDPRFSNNPLVTGEPNIRFYAGAPLVTPDGFALGTLCVIDHLPRALSTEQKTALSALSRNVMAQLELRRVRAAHRKTKAKLRESEDRALELAQFKHAVDQTLDAVWIFDADSLRLEYVNQGAVKQLGYGQPELLQMTPLDFTPDCDDQAFRAKIALILNGSQNTMVLESSHRHKDGASFPVSIQYQLVHPAQQAPRIMAVSRNIRERRTTEAKIRRLNNLCSVLARCNEAVGQCNSEDELFPQVCRIAVESGGMKMAWIGLLDQSTEMVLPAASFGYRAQEYLQDLRISTAAKHPLGQGLTGTAIRENRTVWCQDLESDPRAAPWRQHRAGFGWGASAVLPLLRNGVPIAALTLNADAIGAFDVDIRRLLVDMAAIISSALDHFAHQAAMHTVTAQSHAVVVQSPVMLAQCDGEQRYRFVNQPYADLFALAPADIVGKQMHHVLSVADYVRARPYVEAALAGQACEFERDLPATSQGVRTVHACYVPERDASGRVVGVTAAIIDVTERKAAEEKIRTLAYHDLLTGLPNRRLLFDRLQQALGACARHQRHGGMLLIDLDLFKNVNNNLGQAQGDQMLIETAKRLIGCLRPGDTVARVASTVARMGGDQFVVLLEDLNEDALEAASQATSIGERIQTALRQPYTLADAQHRSSASIGVTLFGGDDATSTEGPLKRANWALHQAKADGRDTLRIFDPVVQAEITQRAALEADLHQAIEKNQFVLHFQPQVSLHTGRVTGVEALIRWQREDGHLVPPNDFIPAAERTKLIVPLGRWVIEEACRQIRRWQDAGLPEIRVAVNVSAQQFLAGDLDAVLANALKDNDVAPHCLEIELTESVLMQAPAEATRMLGRIKSTGVSVALDDFGTGYSSLAYLGQFPIDTLKIDRFFVQTMVTEPVAAAIVTTIIDLAHRLRLTVVAESVETEAQLGLLRKHGCDQMQGYLFSRPLAEPALRALLLEDKRLPPGLDAGLHQKTLLLVNDEPNITASLRRALRIDGYRILTAQSGEEALELMATHDVDVVLAGQRMPNMSGTELLRRACVISPNTVRLILSGYTDLETVTRSVNEGCIYKFMTKPWEDEELRANIADAFRHSEMGRKLSVNTTLAI